jgi:hypothetical protein
MEVLSIVAYEQPITRAEISATNSSGVIKTLLARRSIGNDPRSGPAAAHRSLRRAQTLCPRLAWARSLSYHRDLSPPPKLPG